METIEQYGIFEMPLFVGDARDVTATFSNGCEEKNVEAFSRGDGKAMVRFMPHTTGRWRYEVVHGGEVQKGMFDCVSGSGENHGVVRTSGFHFTYADGTRYLPFGTTCYAWVHQPDELMAQTLETLQGSPFNKVRMCVFPKSMAYNHNEPEYFPFHKKEDGTWDIHAPQEQFWRRFEAQVAALGRLGIEADIILFHPYDRWGFSNLSREESLEYVGYCVRRLSAYHNVWWSLANEYELLQNKSYEDWDVFAEKIKECDIYNHLISIHDFCNPYPKRDWMTHCSVQGGDTERAQLWRYGYKIPVVNDECGYEGNLEYRWGNLSAFELVNRMWIGIVSGGYCSHGETFHRDDEVVWWAKGGRLVGGAVERIRFLKNLLEGLPAMDPVICFGGFEGGEVEGQGTEFMRAMKDLSQEQRDLTILGMLPLMMGNETCRLYYFGRGCPCRACVSMPSAGTHQIEVIDVWEMTREVVQGGVDGDCMVELPSKEGVAVLITRTFHCRP